MRKMSENGINSLIKNYEGYKDKSYECLGGVYTLGWGSTIWLNGEPVKKGMTCTRAEAETVMRRDIAEVSKWVDGKLVYRLRPEGSVVDVIVPQWVFDACVSLAYNVGMAAWANSTALKKINAGEFLRSVDNVK